MQFRGKYWFLSNMYPCKITITIQNKNQIDTFTFQCVESAFQALKCPARAKEFVSLNGFKAKKLGKQVPLVMKWDPESKSQYMLKLLRKKFQIPELKQALLATDSIELVEDNTWNDFYWGRCNGKGKNVLGKLLMQVREELKNE